METVTQTLTDFLQTRIAEDEAAVAGLMSGDGDPEFFWGPDRIRAECEAKRRIVEAFEDERQRMDIYNRDYPLGLLTTEGDLRARLSSNATWAGLEIAVRALALPYADHPEFREEWRP